jgi:hypothetical protein
VGQVWALVPVAFFRRELPQAPRTGRKCVCLAPQTRALPKILYARDRPSAGSLRASAGSSRELRGRPALAHFQQGVLTIEDSHEQVLMTLDKPSFSQYGDEINLPIDWHGSQHPSSIDLSQPVDGQPDREFYCRCNLDAAL